MGEYLSLGISHPADDRRLPEQVAIFLAVVKLAPPGSACRDGTPQLGIYLRRSLSTFQQARLLTDGFFESSSPSAP